MLSIRTIENHFSNLSQDQLSVLIELRNLVGHIAPNATEVLKHNGITYFHADRGGPVSAGICQILTRGDHIELAFIHGAFLPDPAGLLEGHEKAKRYIRLESYENTPWPYLEKLIEAHSRFDPYAQTFLADRN